MSERTILVEGVRMTKVALEKALRELDVPFNAGDIVRRHNSDTLYVVVSESVRYALSKAYRIIGEDSFVVISLSDGHSYCGFPASSYQQANL